MPSSSQHCPKVECGFNQVGHTDEGEMIVEEAVQVLETIHVFTEDASPSPAPELSGMRRMASRRCAHAILEGQCAWFDWRYDEEAGMMALFWKRSDLPVHADEPPADRF